MKNECIKLSVIIVTYKSNAVITGCLASIEKYNDIGEQLEVIVVDNYPHGQWSFARAGTAFPFAVSFENRQNGGFGQGNNVGARMAKGEYLLFLNPDTELLEPIFAYAVERFRSNSRLAVFGMLLYDGRGKPCRNSFGVMPEKKSLFPGTLWWPLIRFCNRSPGNIFPLGADLFIRRELFLAAGGFDEGMFLCYEEPDLVRRLPRGSLVRVFNKKIRHLEGHTTDPSNVERRLRHALESERHYFVKHGLNYQRFVKRSISSLKMKQRLQRLFSRKTSAAEDFIFAYYSGLQEGSR